MAIKLLPKKSLLRSLLEGVETARVKEVVVPSSLKEASNVAYKDPRLEGAGGNYYLPGFEDEASGVAKKFSEKMKKHDDVESIMREWDEDNPTQGVSIQDIWDSDKLNKYDYPLTKVKKPGDMGKVSAQELEDLESDFETKAPLYGPWWDREPVTTRENKSLLNSRSLVKDALAARNKTRKSIVDKLAAIKDPEKMREAVSAEGDPERTLKALRETIRKSIVPKEREYVAPVNVSRSDLTDEELGILDAAEKRNKEMVPGRDLRRSQGMGYQFTGLPNKFEEGRPRDKYTRRRRDNWLGRGTYSTDNIHEAARYAEGYTNTGEDPTVYQVFSPRDKLKVLDTEQPLTHKNQGTGFMGSWKGSKDTKAKTLYGVMQRYIQQRTEDSVRRRYPDLLLKPLNEILAGLGSHRESKSMLESLSRPTNLFEVFAEMRAALPESVYDQILTEFQDTLYKQGYKGFTNDADRDFSSRGEGGTHTNIWYPDRTIKKDSKEIEIPEPLPRPFY